MRGGLRVVAAGAVLVVLVAGCGGGRTSTGEPAGPPGSRASGQPSTATTVAHAGLEVAEVGFSTLPGAMTSTFAVVVRNPDPSQMATGVAVTITFLDVNGGVVTTSQAEIGAILPDARGAAANGVNAPGAVTANATATAATWKAPPTPIGAVTVSDTTSEDEGGVKTSMSGVATSTWSTERDVQVLALLRDGAGVLKGGTFFAALSLPANGSKSFSLFTMGTVPSTWTPEYVAVYTARLR